MKHNLTLRQYLIERANLDQWRAWDAHQSSNEALAEGRLFNAAAWQDMQTHYASCARDDLLRLIHESTDQLDAIF